MKRDILSLVGMPGNGKTTSAQKLYQDPSVRMHFDIRVWCIVSQLYRKRDVFFDILCQLDSGYKRIGGMLSDDEMAEKITQNLKKRKYLIIIDDIWDIKPWKDLRKYLPNDNNGSRILITTRQLYVAKHTSSIATNVHSLRPFTELESYELLEKKSGLKYYHSDVQLLQVGHEIASSCKGLPLAIAVIAGHLANVEKNLEEWKKIFVGLSNRILNDTERPNREMLEWSYNCLPNHLKPCFLYAGVLGAYKAVNVWKLKLLWIAEGFVCDNQFESLDKQAEDYLMDLINRSLVIPTKERAIGGVKEFRMHDLLKDFCLELSEEHHFMHKIKSASWPQPFDSEDLIHETDDLHKFSIWSRGCNIHTEKTCGLSFGSGYSVRSILTRPFGSFGKEYLHAAIDSMDFEDLQVVDLSDEFIFTDILQRIKPSSHLKYLAAGGTFPSSFANFRSLEILIFEDHERYEDIVVLDSIWDMETLRNVHVNGLCVRFQLQRSTVGKKSSFPEKMETLSTPYFETASDAEILRKMPMLRKLSCKYGHHFEYSTNCFNLPNLDFLTQLTSLKVSGYFTLKPPLSHYYFNFSSNLKKLSLHYFKISWDEISVHGRKLPNLEVLKMETLGIGTTWRVVKEDFPNLRYLKISMNMYLTEWFATEESFPKLEQLHLERVTKLEEIPSSFEEIVCLREISVDYCKSSLCDSAIRIEKVQKEELLNEKFVVNVRSICESVESTPQHK